MAIYRPVATLATESSGGDPMAAATALLGAGDLDLPQAGVHRLVVDLGTGPGHDRVDLFLSHLSPLAATEPATELRVALANAGDPVDVLAADVLRVDQTPTGVHVVALAPSHRLSDLRIARTYVQQTVADVVEDLLAEAEVAAGSVDAGQSLAQYHLDGRRSAWDSIHALARLFGAEITSGADGSLSFVPAPGASAGGALGGLGGLAGAAAGVAGDLLGLGGGGLRRGANLLGWATGPRRAEALPVPGVAPLGAASSLGASRGHHVLKEPDDGSSATLVIASLRDTDGADGAAQALTARATRTRTGGRLVVVGDPTLRAGTDVDVDDETWHVRRVQHCMDAVSGYVCELTVEGTA
jgi:hypothetical protein